MSCGTRPASLIPARPASASLSGPSPTNVERPPAAPLEGAREAKHVLSLRQRAQAEEPRALSVPSELRACFRLIARREALEVDAAVDDLGLPGGIRDGLLELSAKPLGHRHDRGGAPDDVPRRGADPAELPDVGHVLAVGGDDERRARGERRDESGRDEEVRVDDVRPRSPGAPHRIAEEACVASRPSLATVDHGALDLVTARQELALEGGDEHSEIRVRRARVHLGDEEDPQGGYPRVTWRSPRHISSVVPSPQRM